MKTLDFFKLLTIMVIGLLTARCAKNEAAPDFIGRQDVKLDTDLMTPEALWGMGRIGDVAVAPEGDLIAYTVSYYSVEENKSHTVIYVMNADGSDNKMATKLSKSQSSPVWIEHGKKLAYLSSEDGKSAVWITDMSGGSYKLTGFDYEVEGFKFSPDESKIILIAQIPSNQSVTKGSEKYADLPKASGIIVTDLMHKHWDEWVTTVPHPFVADVKDMQLSNIRDILKDEPYECPSKPFGGIEQLEWSPCGGRIIYSCKKLTGANYAVSTDSDIYEYDLDAGNSANLCKPADYIRPEVDLTSSLKKQSVNVNPNQDLNSGYDTNPQYSPDGKYASWLSMARDGYESDRARLCVLNLTTGEKFYVTESFESSVDNYLWINSLELCFTGVWHGATQIYKTDLKGNVTKLTDGVHDYASLALCKEKLIAKRHSMTLPDDIYSVDLQSGEAQQLTKENEHILSKLVLGKVEERWTTTTDGKQMQSWVIYPPHFDASKKYPTLLFCEGGPQSPVSQFWSYRWNFQIMAAHGYIIIAPNRRGLPGYGMEWLEEISGDYGGQCMKDYLTAIDDLATEPYVDKEKLGCVGASFGGYSVYWLAGHHNKRFKAFIAHDGMFNFNQQYLETEEMWFVNWDLGGAYWRKENAVAQASQSFSPHLYVDKWDTPILCIHGEKDYRILASQGESAFNAAKLRGIPAELLLYPDENHWVLKPQNGILWQRTFFEWLDKWLK